MGGIQRSPRGILELLSQKGVENLPQELLRELRPTLDVLQFYGLQQQQAFINTNAALAEGANVSIAGSGWAVLFGANALIAKTATMTALSVRIVVIRNGSLGLTVASRSFDPFGATETGSVSLPWVAPYPMVLAPPWEIRAFLEILGTDATANVSIVADFGALG